ncbi:MAG TPA: replication-relaxation family protein [Pseudonocardiaceae bacterium]|jgi:hypothetical protein|nr:replication-relaxation family protein [Pseudonocardiaceae bacterium]
MVARVVESGLPNRDRAVIELVAKFRQMTSGQIRDSLFAGLASATPVDRTLKRLVEQKHLSRLKRLVGGDQGGSGQFVYQLGRAGWKLLDKPGSYWVPRAVNLHTLAIADCYAAFKRAEQDGQLEVIQFTTEPECHQAVGNVLLTPDAYVEVGNRTEQVKHSYWLEVDRGTEHLEVIQEKCERYYRAYGMWQEDYFPLVLFVVPDEHRQSAVERVVQAGPSPARRLLRVCVSPNVQASLIGGVL